MPIPVTSSFGFGLLNRSEVFGPKVASHSVTFTISANGPSYETKASFGVTSTVVVIPPQPRVLLGPVQVSTDVVRAISAPFAQASNVLRKAILAIVSTTGDDSNSPNSYLTAFTTTDGGVTWSEVAGPEIFQIIPFMWQGEPSLNYQPKDYVSFFVDHTVPPSDPNGTSNSPPYPTIIGSQSAFDAYNWGREALSDDIFTINAPSGCLPNDPQQQPPGIGGLWVTGLDPGYSNDDFVNVSQQVFDQGQLNLYKFNLESFTWTDLGEVGSFVVDPIYGQYEHGFYFGLGLALAGGIRIVGISGGRGVAIGSHSLMSVGLDTFVTIPAANYPFGTTYGSVQIINFSTSGGSSVSYVTDPDALTLGGVYSDGLVSGVMGVDPISGDMFVVGEQLNTVDSSVRVRTMRWPKGSTSEVPIFDVGGSFTGASPTPIDSISNVFNPNIWLYRKSDSSLTGNISWLGSEDGDFSTLNASENLLVNRGSAAWVSVYCVAHSSGIGFRLRAQKSYGSPYTNVILYQDTIAEVGAVQASPAAMGTGEMLVAGNGTTDISTASSDGTNIGGTYFYPIYTPYYWSVGIPWPPPIGGGFSHARIGRAYVGYSIPS